MSASQIMIGTQGSQTQGSQLISLKDLSKELIYHIFSKVASKLDIHALLLTNKEFYEIIVLDNSNFLWRAILPIHFPYSFQDNPNDHEPKKQYASLAKISHNIKIKKHRVHEFGSNIPPFQIDQKNNMYFIADTSAANKSIIEIYSLSNGEKLHTVDNVQSARGTSMNCVKVHDKKLFAVSNDFEIMVWDLTNGNKLFTLLGLANTVTNLVVQGDKVAATTVDCKIKVWDLTKMKCVLSSSYQLSIGQIALEGNILAYRLEGRRSSCIIVRDLTSGTELFRLEERDDLTGNVGEPRLAIQNNKIISGPYYGTIKVWDLENRKLLHTIDNVSAMNVIENKLLFTHSCSGVIKALDLISGEEQCIFTSPPSPSHNLWHRLDLQADKVIVTHYNHLSNYENLEILDLESGEKQNSYSTRIKSFSNGKLISSTFPSFDHGHGAMHPHPIHPGAMHPGAMHPGAMHPGAILVYDFNFDSLSNYDGNTLEQNLSILEQIAKTGNAEEKEELIKTLHPEVQQRLQQQAFNCSRTSKLNTEAVLRMQIEVILELLLDRMPIQDDKRVSELLDQLISIDPHQLLQSQSLKESILKLHFKNIASKEKAVVLFQKCLKEKWGPDAYPLLVDFGILSKEEYSQKLQCTPDVLKKVGIVSLDDLQVLGLLSAPPVEYLKAAEQTSVDQQLNNLSKQVEERIYASERLGIVLYDSSNSSSKANIWAGFKEQFEMNKALIEGKYEIHKNNSHQFEEIIQDVNRLIEQFNAVQREYELDKLKAYIHQQDAQLKWGSLREQNVHRLVDYVAKNPEANLFTMGD